MKTKDGYDYQPGMTLYYVLAGQVIARPTSYLQDRNTEYAAGTEGGAYQVDAHFAKKEPAYIVAVNHGLRLLEIARLNLAKLNKDRLECLLGPSTDRSRGNLAKITELPETVSVSDVAKNIDGIPSISGY